MEANEHLWVHTKYYYFETKTHFKPGQGSFEHSLFSVFSPAQSLPPLAGAGLEHVLDRDWLPPPHVTEQSPHGFQSDH